MNIFIRSSILLLTLGLSTSVWAEEDDRKNREERRALKMSEVDQTANISEAYRQAAHEKRLESMQRAKEMLAGGQLNGDAKAKVQFRLAEMYFEEGRFYYFDEMQKYNKEYDDCFNGIPKGCNVNKLTPDNSASQKWQKQAIRLYDDILTNYPQYSRADEVLYSLGNAYQEIKDPDKAVQKFEELTKKYQQSKFLADAYLQIGEYYFDRNKAYEALVQYEKASKFQNSPNYGFAVYKLSWCYYNVGEYDQAIEGMKTVVSYSEMQQQQGGATAITLQEEALKDLVRFFADAGDMQEAEDYFRSLGKDELYNNMLRKLASMYFSQGKFEQSITTYRKLIAETPDSPDAPNYQNEIINAYQQLHEKEQTLKEIQKLLQQYGKTSTWASKNAANPEAIKKAQNYVEDALRRVAVNYSQEAKKLGSGSKAMETYLLAEKAYRVYLQEFPDGKNSYDMRYAFAELIYLLADKGKLDAETKEKYFGEAYENYMLVVKTNPQGSYSEFCADAAVYAAQEMINIEKKKGLIKERKSDTDISAIPMSVWEEKKLKAQDQYTQIYPNTKNTITHAQGAAVLLFQKNQLDEASSRFRTVISMDPKSAHAMDSANDILNALALFSKAKEESGDFAGAAKDVGALKDTAKAFYEQEGLGNKKFKTDMMETFQASSIAEIDLTLKASPKAASDKHSAADKYMLFIREYPNADKADLVVNTSAVYYYESDDLRKSMETRQYLIDTYPKSAKFIENVARLGFAYESIAQFETASEWYEKLFSLDQEYASTKDALHRAAIFRESLGQYDKALANKEAYLTTYPDDERVVGILIDMAHILEKKGDLAGAYKAFYNFYSKPPTDATDQQKFYARFKYGELGKKLNKDISKHWKNTLDMYEKLDDELKQDKSIRMIVEEIKFDLALENTKSYYDLKIDGPGAGRSTPQFIMSVLNKQIAKKQTALKELNDQYLEVAGMAAGKFTISAIVEIGKAYEDYADAIKNSYVPSFMDEDQQELYKMQLEDQAFPYYNMATDAYQKALEFAFQYNLYTDASAEATRRLGALKPSEYPELTEIVPNADFLTSKQTERTFFVNAQ